MSKFLTMHSRVNFIYKELKHNNNYPIGKYNVLYSKDCNVWILLYTNTSMWHVNHDSYTPVLLFYSIFITFHLGRRRFEGEEKDPTSHSVVGITMRKIQHEAHKEFFLLTMQVSHFLRWWRFWDWRRRLCQIMV